MADNRQKQANRDRSKVSTSEDHEVEYLMFKFDISKKRALELIIKHGGSRKNVEAELTHVHEIDFNGGGSATDSSRRMTD
jgi:hypothetical protein